ncbi:TetR/AcrR family transcriptional regulator [Flagellimonas sp. CMM7]|uniref:TetR/AcrR family transcriptional regulator n=1 Tax=Flagellimonas sp. CMM7 TaxID=2654676 RepID=UPI0013D1610C|nr:TetR/AcrR family transcriptional regulator [Flagellimonas sp. CMM7]UII81241.1 TetR/AcrR family transcriptional regulator [Flagellimonas sp. CMM7]
MPRVKQFDEKEILNKAMELFWEKGFHATSMQNLVSYLGINRASLYDTFGGKEELFNKAFEQYRSVTGNTLKAIFDKEGSVREGLKKLFDNAIDEAITDEARKGCFVVNTTTELIPGDKAIHQVLSDNKANVEALFINYIQKGINSGEFDTSKNAESIGLMLFALFSGLRVLAKVDSNPDKLNLMVQQGLSVLD